MLQGENKAPIETSYAGDAEEVAAGSFSSWENSF